MSKEKLVYILGGGYKKGKDGRFRSTNFEEMGLAKDITGNRVRVVAARWLYRDDNKVLLITSGGMGIYRSIPGAIPVSWVIKDELLELGVPRENILLEDKSDNTFQQLKELIGILEKNNFKKIIIISNQYHLPRVKAMIEYVKELGLLKKMLHDLKIKLESAEKVLIKYNPEEWEKEIKNAYKSEAMGKRIELEERGVKDIKEGRYKLKI